MAKKLSPHEKRSDIAIAISPDGKQIASGSADAKVHDAVNREAVRTMAVPGGRPNFLL